MTDLRAARAAAVIRLFAHAPRHELAAKPGAAQPEFDLGDDLDEVLIGSWFHPPSCSPAGTDRALLARRGECVTCGLLVEGESMPPGEVRRCDSHADCSFNRTCDDRGCTWQETDAYCTHRGSTFMGLPPGTGFCAVPDTSCGVARSIAHFADGDHADRAS